MGSSELNSLQARKTLSPSSKFFWTILFDGKESGLEDLICLLNQNIPSYYRNHKISAMIIQEAHIANLHAGPTLLAHILIGLWMNRQTRSYPMAFDGNLFKTSLKDFGKGSTMSTCIPFSKEPSGGSLKGIFMLATWLP
ncbi:hypothetical protein CEXT_468051 [Caerostris extrusa]|uniref:Uncharacterized protein n=1 Tax=Caerostris extrusa TaxID=172846 RepID=A0AAV4XVC0_CAEEX|nr:hypothetical protein CEXT_468051 [Caerostris extrusa]